jgi:putative transposase
VKFGFIAKHRGIWPVDWVCEALGVSRGGFYAWLTRPCSQRSRSDEELGAKVRGSFLASDRTYGTRRVWHDMLAEGITVREMKVGPSRPAVRFWPQNAASCCRQERWW